MGKLSCFAQAVKCAFMATLNKDGFDEPSASGGMAVLIFVIPALIASKQQSVPSPVVQWVWSSTVLLPAALSTAGARVLVRSGVKMPPGSLRMTRYTSRENARRISAAKYSSVWRGDRV